MTREEAWRSAKGYLYDALSGEEADEIIKALEQESYEDAISRQAVLEQTYNWSKDEFLRVTNPFDYLRKRINSLQPVKQNPCRDMEEIREVVGCDADAETKCKMISNILTTKPHYFKKQEPKTGHWIKYGIPRCGEQHYQCTSCEYYINFGQWGEVYTKQFKYCPNCGARMIEPKERKKYDI